MIKVLQINAGSGIYGGVSAFILNIYRNINREEIQFDFLTTNKTTYGHYSDEINDYGGTIYELGINGKTLIGKVKIWKELKVFLNKHKYDIIHINSGVLLFNCFAAGACRKYSDAKIVVHSHSNGGRSKIKELLSDPLKIYLSRHADQLLACSTSAAEYMFPPSYAKATEIINNGIISDKFKYDSEIRHSIRKDLDVDHKFVIGHVGRFTHEKNHEFLLELLAVALKRRNNIVLMLVGEGPLLQSIKEKANNMGLTDSILFLGARNDVNKLYQAMDVFVLPSKFEGFGIVNVEAQASGLKCVTSTAVPEEVNISGNVIRLSLDSSIDKWVDELLNVPTVRTDNTKKIQRSGFDITSSAQRLGQIYIKITSI